MSQTDPIIVPLKADDKLSPDIEKAGFSFTELSSAINLAQQALGKLKQAYDFAKQGAEIQLTEQRFARLAETIGANADIMDELREVTRGLYSDTELMSSASDLMGLGLVKSSDELLRLSKVSSGLNMNMNQLVLTLTNMTTMRFDALGVSVDGFKEKVAELEATGMSANDAFKEAFLQQAEMQLEKVGEAADSTAGTFMRLEAQVSNSTSEFKKMAADAIEPTIKKWLEVTEAVSVYNESQGKTAKEAGITWQQYGAKVAEINEAVSLSLERGTDAYSAQKEAMREAIPVMEEIVGVSEEMSKYNEGYLDSIGNLSDAYENHHEKMLDLTTAYPKEVEELDKLVKTRGWDAEAIQKQQEKIDELKVKMQEEADSFEENSNRRILQMITEQLAIDGLTEEETRAIEERGIAMGVYTQEAVDGWRAERDAAVEAVAEITASIASIPDEKNVSVNITSNLGGYEYGTEQWNNIAYAGRQHGGPVAAGATYKVGEAGPELFRPGMSGTIIPNGSNGGGGGINEGRLARKIATSILKGLAQQ